MLVVLSDLHFADGSASHNVSVKAFDILREEILSQVTKFYNLSLENDEIKPIKVVDILLNGDIFDLVRTTFWKKTENINKRPWMWSGNKCSEYGMNQDDNKVLAAYSELLQEVLNADISKAYFEFLNKLYIQLQKVSIAFGNSVTIEVNVHYVVGNHDRAIHCFQELKNLIIEKMPSSIKLEFLYNYTNLDYGVLCRHGNEWDKHCRGAEFYNLINNKNIDVFNENSYKTQNIGEINTAEVISGIVHYVTKNSNSLQLHDKIKYIDNVKPVSEVFNWLAGLGESLTIEERKIIMQACIDSLKDFLKTDFAKRWDDLESDFIVYGDLTDYFNTLYKVLRTFKSFDYQKIVTVFDNIMSKFHSSDSYEKAAKNELEQPANKNISYVIYGHTHTAKKVVFSEELSGKKKMYINFGHWGESIYKANDGKTFTGMELLPMVFIYKTDEGRFTNYPNIDFWDGSRIEN